MYKTEQEKFWSGKFGDEYINRNCDNVWISSSVNMYSKIFGSCSKLNNVLEIGPNIGMNLIAINKLKPDLKLSGIEINEKAAKILSEVNGVEVFNESALEFNSDRTWDFVFTRGVLIHINPNHLEQLYEKMYNLSNKYICFAEYYNPTPMVIPYRGESDKLFKRDFAGDIMTKYPDLELVDYGFEYRYDNNFPNDDITWFLMRKKDIKLC